MLDDAQRNVETWQDKHREATAEVRVLSDKARQATALADEYEQDLGTARQQLEDEQRAVSGLQVRRKIVWQNQWFYARSHACTELRTS